LFSARALSTILIVAALSRFGFSVWVVGLHAMTKGDEADYHAIATHLADGRGFVAAEETPTARRPPAYPVFLSLLYRAAGPNPAAGRIAQIVLGVIVVWLTARLGHAWFGASAGREQDGWPALNPISHFLSGYLLRESLLFCARRARVGGDAAGAGTRVRRALSRSVIAGSPLTRRQASHARMDTGGAFSLARPGARASCRS
jgi:hypothetical protein